MATKIYMEALSPTMDEGRLISWRVNEGASVSEGDVLAEVETDKSNVELCARGTGVLRKRLLAAGETVSVGTMIGVIAGPDEDISGILGVTQDGATSASLSTVAGSVSVPTQQTSETRSPASRVFIVHGHDEAAKEKVARLVERLGLDAVILSERTNAGRTIIEKFEAHAGNADFAVVILTPDDLGEVKPMISHAKPRARQNVILELGYFFGRLGRARVCALYVPGVELPSDILGLVWVEIDSMGAWRYTLAEELAEAGFEVDFNKLRSRREGL